MLAFVYPLPKKKISTTEAFNKKHHDYLRANEPNNINHKDFKTV
jgi:hypothetical protein